MVQLTGLPAFAVFEESDTADLTTVFERAVRCAVELSGAGDRRVSFGVHVGTVAGVQDGGRLVPDHDDSVVIRAVDLARAARPGDVLVSDRCVDAEWQGLQRSEPVSLPSGRTAFVLAEPQTVAAAPTTPDTASEDPPPDDGAHHVPRAMRTRKIGSLVPPGRERDLSEALRSIERVRDGDGHVFIVEAPPGIGRSSLLAVAQRASSRVDMAWFVSNRPADESNVPFAGIRHAISVLCGVEAADDAATVRARIARLAELGVRNEDIETLSALFTGVVARGVVLGDRPSLFGRVLRQALHALSFDRPVGLAIDDAHHADPQSRAIFDGLVPHLEGARVLVWLSTTPGGLDGITGERVVRHALSLPTLDALVSFAQRVGAALGVRPDRSMLHAIAKAAHGQPRWVDEATRLLAEAGRMGDEASCAELPESVDALMALRIRGSDPALVGVVQRASLLGDDIETAWLARVLRQDPETIERVLGTAAAHGWVRRQSEGRWSFRSQQLRAAFSASIELYARRDAHARILEELEASVGTTRGRRLDELARHAVASGDARRAIDYLRQLADRRVSERAPAEALQALESARVLARGESGIETDELLELLLRTGEVASDAVRFEDAWDALERCATLAGASPHRERTVARCLLAQGRVRMAEGRLDDGCALLERAMRLADGLRDRRLTGEVYGALGEAWSKNRDLERAMGFLGKAVHVAEESGDLEALGRLLPSLANAAGGVGDYAAADRLHARALDMADRQSDDLLRGRVLQARSLLAYFRGDLEVALADCVAALEIASAHGAVEQEVVIAHNAGDAALHLGDLQAAHRYLSRSRDLSERFGLFRTVLTNDIYLAWLDALRFGNPPPAHAAAAVEPRLRAAWTRADELGLLWESMQARYFVAMCLIARNESGAARPLLHEVENASRRIHLQFMERRAAAALEQLP